MSEFDLQFTTNGEGTIERFGATTKLTDALATNYTDRGRKAASLLMATLTETPYMPEVDGQDFSVEVSNVYRGFGDESEVNSPDTVEEAAAALAEFVTADVPGADRIKLETYKTGYGKILSSLLPGRRDPSGLRAAFDEGFVESSRRSGIELKGPTQGLKIIRRAPEKLEGLRLSSHNLGGLSSRTQTHEMVTIAGRVVTIWSSEGYGLNSKISYYMSTDTNNIRLRGGRAPRPTEIHDIGRRAVSLRTNSSIR